MAASGLSHCKSKYYNSSWGCRISHPFRKALQRRIPILHLRGETFATTGGAETRPNVRTLTGSLYGAHNVWLNKDGHDHLSYGLTSSAMSLTNLRHSEARIKGARDFCNGSWLLSGSFDPRGKNLQGR